MTTLLDANCDVLRPVIGNASFEFGMTFDSGDVSEKLVEEGGPQINGSVSVKSSDNWEGPFPWKVPCAYDSKLRVTRFAIITIDN
jgi:hypothetical protein